MIAILPLILSASIGAGLQEETVQWHPSWSTAFKKAKISGKPVLALFWASW